MLDFAHLSILIHFTPHGCNFLHLAVTFALPGMNSPLFSAWLNPPVCKTPVTLFAPVTELPTSEIQFSPCLIKFR